MEFDWTTFVLEIINFLVLVWILKRFFYRPVLDVIARRRARIEGTLAEAQATEERALALKGQYENRLDAWEQERQAARGQLAAEVAQERARLMQGVRAAVEAERDRNRVLDERQRREWQRAAQEQAVALGAGFVAKLLAGLADAALDERIVDALIADLARLPEEQKRALAAAAAASGARLRVESARSLSEAARARLGAALDEAVGCSLPADYAEDAALVGGVLVSIGPWLLHANLRDEMQFFSGGARHAP